MTLAKIVDNKIVIKNTRELIMLIGKTKPPSATGNDEPLFL